MAPKATASARKSILISGDVMADNHIYEGDRLQLGSGKRIGTYLRRTAGGARLLFDILDAVRTQDVSKPNARTKASSPLFDLRLGLDTDDLDSWPPSFQSFGVWSPSPRTSRPDEKVNVWRLSKPLGYGVSDEKKFHAPVRESVLKKPADILVLDDGGLTFRHARAKAAWPGAIARPAKTSPEWVVLKTAGPIGRGDLWRAVCDDRFAERLVVITSIVDLRKEPVRISEGLSWERTALELVDELSENPSLAPLKRCRHCIVSFGCAGALHVDRSTAQPTFRLIYDPAHLEGDWEATVEGNAIGYMSCLVAGVVNALAEQTASRPDANQFKNGIIAGLNGERALLLAGHGPVSDDTAPDPHLGDVAKAILTSENDQERYYSAPVPLPTSDSTGRELRRRWTILSGVPTETYSNAVQPQVGIARRIALFGIRELNRIPVQHTGNLRTVDRDEIESVRIVETAIRAYEKKDGGKKPLSIALFGAPGSGKSFTVKQITKSALGKNVPILEFNLSQFSGSADLIGALHQVRDKALGPHTPVVFWDEFDSRNYEWLQYLLAPMQDGAFQEGQLTHPIGKCIFIFAGGTSCDFEHFGPSPGNAKAQKDFKGLKGPDFKSRIHNSLSVLGPNPAPKYDETLDIWGEDPQDICFPIRRALLIRSILGLKKNEELNIEGGMLTALLQVSKYTHGVRSLENVLTTVLRSNDGGPLRRSDLPHTDVLAMHVNCEEFLNIMNRDLAFKRLADKLAPYVHGIYCGHIKDTDGEAVYLTEFDVLPEEIRDDNHAAAARIPEILGHAGLYVVPRPESAAGKPAKLEAHVENIFQSRIEMMAEEEHNGWMNTRLSNGWQFGSPRNDEDKIHDALIPYADLDQPTKDKDISAVNAYKDILALVNYTITNQKPE
jgi:hypothetical protein